VGPAVGADGPLHRGHDVFHRRAGRAARPGRHSRLGVDDPDRGRARRAAQRRPGLLREVLGAGHGRWWPRWCGTPIYAAHDGDVIKAGPATGFGDAIFLDNGVDAVTGAAIVTWYGHEFADGIEVHVGDHVKAGQEIGKVGSNGQSTGCHDHFEVHVNGVAVDPVPFMAAHGAPLG
jgi:murein DD-endopeptidase MepM/ murein hydrolase activator NlpD